VERDTITVPSRFQGPPTSGNGGYVCGRLARYLGAPAAVVRLRVPPPLDTALAVRAGDDSFGLYDGETQVAEARAAEVSVDPGAPPAFAVAEEASKRFKGFESHWYPCCFVCGPERAPGDGLRIFPGRLDGGDRVAAPWIPDASLASADTGRVAPEFLWSALDCPGAFSFPEPEVGGVLLGELTVALQGEVAVGERCVLTAWQLSHEGRKHHTVTALFGESGDCRGVGLGTWFEVG